MGASPSDNYMNLHCLLQGWLYLFTFGGRMIIKWIVNIGSADMDQNEVAQDRNSGDLF
jgi:hypothetical protein